MLVYLFLEKFMQNVFISNARGHESRSYDEGKIRF